MIQLGAPGVYIVEAPSGLQPITAVATSIAAFVDFFPEGPTDRAVQIFGATDYQRYFGAIDPHSAASYAVSQFFLNGGSSAWVVRVVDATAVAASVIAASGGSPLFEASAVSEGVWGNNVRFSVTPNNDGSFNFVVTRYDGPTANAKPISTETFTALSATATDANYYAEVVNDGSALLRLANSAHPAQPIPAGTPVYTGTLSDDLGNLVLPASNSASTLSTVVTNGLTLSVTLGTAASNTTTRTAKIQWGAGQPFTAAPQDIRTLRAMLAYAIQNATPKGDDWDAAFAGLAVDYIPIAPSTAHPGGSGKFYLRSNRRAKTYNPSETIQVSGGAGLQLAASAGVTPNVNVQEYILGSTLTAGSQQAGVAGTDGGLPDANTLAAALVKLDKVDLFNLLLIPRMADLDPTGSSTTPAPNQALLVSQALTYCDQRRAMLFIDIPKYIDNPQKVQDWLDANDGFRDNNSIIYFPRVELPDPANNNRLTSFAASGTMAGVYARTDGQRGVWKAPAGIDATLRGVVQLDYKMTDAENGVLNPLGINCLRVFPIYGEIAWGARTLEGADVIGSQWKYIPIRRLALMIEESLFRGTKWVVFEPNDEPLWAKIRQNVGAFMLGLFRQGAFQGGTPSQAFFVKCDAETTTANDRQLGIVNIQVGFAPLKPAEFVVITISQIPDQN